ncbi:AraC family transcriptional regulator, regulatory protein of adaptative response / methylphosphotriester-DNA alkyltransferase methyltransferase [Psychrobacillus sp. OK028]|uniref:bifunctional transcriptional activator/DNA repair enzyme AdaA n=1 Tax=Psychrobacillus sp. OK028 TaxID=1884359 RepID=UPI0008900B36|nr:bifunctional transcriptional activator/DNA repair enzyme AdaA [Psychrobacillus sp. OK028]SDN48782.1 AraC family transcriptional regulator, regulatory protein of adaptative response / methylphosphotriester-DNA alkyltransferase methyltransferase [Psychrobacillus sp. OK028]
MSDNQEVMQLTDERWKAITHNDHSYDDIFIYAVKSTGICCRPSCKSRDPKKENIRIFKDVEEALSEGFRPCKRCKPGGIRLPDEEWIVQIQEYINSNYHESLSLEVLADVCHGSPYHLQRTFKRIIGLTPTEYIQQVRISNAMKELTTHMKSIAEVGFAVGLPNTAYFITFFKNRVGQTPKQYQKTMMEVQRNGEK